MSLDVRPVDSGWISEQTIQQRETRGKTKTKHTYGLMYEL